MDEENKTSPSNADGAGKPVSSRLMGSPGGLYNNVKMSVKEANILSVAALAILVVVTLLIIIFGRNGFTVTFDARGGSDVEIQTVQYGEAVAAPDDPTREGYAFTGWYADEACSEQWDFSARTVTDNMTLYAGWSQLP